METSRYAVIGAGLAGAAATWQLAAAGHEVTVLEQQETAAGAEGSSHGSARIFRYPYPDRFYVNLVRRSAALWDSLQQQSGRRLITPTGGVDFGTRRDPRQLAKVMEAEGLEHELVTMEEAAERWPFLSVDTEVLFSPAAGVIDAETTVNSMLELAQAAGAALRTSWEAAQITRIGHGYLIRSTSGQEIEVERIVVAAGGWLPDLLGRLELPRGFIEALPRFEVRQEQAYHFPYAEAEPQWPVLVHKNPVIQTYSLPGGRDAEFRGQKLAEFNAGKVLPSAAHQDGVVDGANRHRIVEYVKRHLPGLVPEPYAETTCLFTNTPDEDFVFDRCEGITVVSPCSGHGAKFAPLIGVLAASAASAGSDEAGRTVLPERFLTAWKD